jgi:exodeoxyribonuclease X
MKILIADSETTGFVEPIEPIEVAHIEITFPSLRIVEEFEKRYLPSGEISLGATAIHHILKQDLLECADSDTYVFPECDYLIGHNIDYDWSVFGKPEVKRICTLALARYLLPDLDSHTQSALMYYFYGAAAKQFVLSAHSALADVRMCKMVLHKLMGLINTKFPGSEISIENLYKLSEVARIPTKITFGKYRGELISNIPADYKRWLLNQPDVDPYLIIALRKK